MINSVAKGTNSFLQSTTTVANSALSGVSDLLSSSTSTVVNSAVKAANSVSNSLNSGIETMNDTFHDVIESTTTALENVPILNSLVAGPNGHTGSNNSHRNGYNGSNNSHKNGYTGSNKNINTNSGQSSSGWPMAVGVFIILLLVYSEL